MKRFICGFVIGAMLFSVISGFAVATYIANPLSYKVLVNGEEFTSDPPPVEIEGRTYLPLRAMGDALGVPVNWNEELWQAEVGVNQDTKETLYDLYNWLVKEIWNNGICDMTFYYTNGTDSTGDTMDAEFTLEQFEKAYAKKAYYDKLVISLSDNYADIKNTYSKVSTELEVVHAEIQKRGATTPSQGFDIGKYEQYADALYQYLYEILYN